MVDITKDDGRGGIADPHLGQLENFGVVLKNIRGIKTENFTPNVKSLEIKENIYSPFVSATMICIDDSGLFTTMPLVGQEEVLIQWEKDGNKMWLNMLVTDISDVIKIKPDVVQFSVSLIEAVEFRNSGKTFSKSYSGKVGDIIKSIIDDQFGVALEMGEGAKNSPTVSVVFPIMRPYQAIQRLLDNVPSNDGSPLFLTTSVWGTKRRLLSMRDMEINDGGPDGDGLVLEKTVLMHQDPKTGSITTGREKYRHSIFDVKIEDAYDTMRLIGAGAYAANATKIDISTKSVNTDNFNYLKHQELHDYKVNNPLQKTYKGGTTLNPFNIQNFPAQQGDVEFLHERYKSKHYSLPQNSKGFSSSHQNIFTQESIEIMGHNAFREKFTGSRVSINCDPIAWLKCGETIELQYRTNVPKYDESSNQYDKINSGEYVIEGITHMLIPLDDQKLDYKYNIFLIRDSMGIAHKE